MIGLEILLGIGANLSTDFVRSCARKAVQSITPIHNHDLQHALITAFLEATEREWKKEEVTCQSQEYAQQIRAAFLMLHQDSVKILAYSQASELSKPVLDALITDDNEKLAEILQQIIKPYLSDIPTEYHEMLAQQLSVSLLEAFTDVLKEDQHKRAWIAFQKEVAQKTLSLLQTQQVSIGSQHQELQAAISRLNEIVELFMIWLSGYESDQPGRTFSKRVVGGPLPTAGETFRDREEALKNIEKYLEMPDVRLICIVGRGGIGKTALLSKLCNSLEVTASRADGIVYVSCRKADYPSVARIFTDIGRMLGSPYAEELRDCWADLTRSLADRTRFLLSNMQESKYFLVLDNLEDCLHPDQPAFADAYTELRDFLEVCLTTPRSLRILVTSREKPFISSTAFHTLKVVQLDSLPEEEAAILLEELDPENDVGLQSASESLRLQAARRCHGVPRALETIVGILQMEPDLTLEKLLRDKALFNKNIIDNLIADHYRRVTEAQRQILQALSAFGKPVPVEALEYVLNSSITHDEIKQHLSTLVHHYFVTCTKDDGTYTLHPLDADYAYAKLSESGDGNLQSLQARVADYYRRTRQQRRDEKRVILREIEIPRFLYLSGRDLNPFRFSRSHSVVEEERKTLEDMPFYIAEFYHRMHAGQYDEAVELLDSIDFSYLSRLGYSDKIAAMREQLVGRLVDFRLATQNLDWLGCAYIRLLDLPKARQRFENGINLAIHAGYTPRYRDFEGNLGRAQLLTGQIGDALIAFEGAVEDAQQAGWRRGEGLWTGRIGEALLALGKRQEARQYFETSIEILQQMDDDRWLGLHLCNFGALLSQEGYTQDAKERLKNALSIACHNENKEGKARCLFNLGLHWHRTGETEAARGCYEGALALRIVSVQYRCMVHLAMLYQEIGEKAAADCFAEGITLCKTVLDKTPDLYEARYLLGLAYLAYEDIQAAEAAYRKALETCSSPGVVQAACDDLRLLLRSRPYAPSATTILQMLEQ